MPYIKKIELKGFKSFGPQTVKVLLDKGFTAITGPNGSGKTNIVDAVLFALGELSVKRLRAENAAKLIFQGSEKAGLEKAKMAKVVIQFDNSDGRIPVDTATVTISREVYRNGQSVYRLNGRRISRVYLMEILSMAGISSLSQNIILQGTITRLADVSPIERRKIIEDLVGIAQYDAEKAEAEEKLRAADLSIRTAMGRIDEVQRRVEDLERERNELLRYNFLKNEIKRFEAVKLSHDIAQIQGKIERDKAQAEKIRSRLERVKAVRDQYRLKRREVESEWRKLSSEIVEEGSSQVLEVQMRIGELKSKITELTSKISSGKTNLESLRKIRENDLQQYHSIRNEIRENRLKIRQLRAEYERILNEINAKQAEHDALAREAAQLWESLGENSKKIREIELQLDRNYKRLAFLRSEQAKSQTAIKIRERRLKDLNERKERFASTLSELEKSMAELGRVQKEQKNQLKSLERTLEKRIAQKEAIEREMVEAGKIADSAREAVVEFATQRELAEAIAAEEKALRSIEELGEVGVIPGVYGRLRNLIKIDKAYQQAIEVAAGGWLDAIVVKDFDAAFTCAETLRRMKLGRIKIIPLEGISNSKPIKIPSVKGVNGAAFSFIKCAKQYEPAVYFIFGDTLVVQEDETALALSNEGYRAVTVDGDLYEPGGALESGYYRAPIDFSAIIPSETAIKSLEEAVTALRQHLLRRENDIASLEEEIDRTRVEIARLSEAITMLDREIARVKRSIKRTKANIKRIDANIKRVESEIEAEKARIWTCKAEKNAIQRETRKLQGELAVLRRMVDPANIQEMEAKREKISEEINTLRQKLGAVQTEISTLQSQYDNVLRTGYKNARIQLSKVEQQLEKVEKEVEEALQEREKLKQELTDLEKSRDELSKTVLSAKEEAQKFTSQIDEIDKVLRKLDAEYEETDRLWNQYQLNIQTSLIQLEQWQNQLKQFGYEKPLDVTPKEIEEAEATLRMLKFEFERIEAVNQLALSHYAEQIARYKELSLRMNELEREKQAIIKFMEEIESKKRKVFLDAFEKINQNLQKYFSKLTGGGLATLKLENPEDPFVGGIDMIVQFPNKPSIVVSGASGGERSVAAVAFLFAIKDFTPAAFYIMDEVDAHLDPFHVSKLADLLLEESEKAQFIIITLKAEMVNKAQKVYGVYGRNGVSNVVSAKFLEVPS
ncbi:MAG: chromosome segregation protein SMC [Candidatus Bathyarchaeota archaeon]|nr:chromosome segregation protein SMC [Candidatus Bathyarchaeota archaeon]MDW8040808.1 chromosome segregation protein SMC [Nitrososphaerota archaeon]